MYKQLLSFILFTLFYLYIPSVSLDAQTKDSREIKNLRAFARLYGYVRFFHPSDESANLDWDKFAVIGVEEVLKCKNDIELKESLKKLYLPIAPAMKIYSDEKDINSEQIYYSKDTTGLDVIAWQHSGVWLSENSNSYRSFRVWKNGSLPDSTYYADIKTNDLKPHSIKLFKKFPKTGEIFWSSLGKDLFCSIPLTLYADSSGTIGKNKNYPFRMITDKLAETDIKSLTADDARIRLADIIIAWNIYQHFYPYFDVVRARWNSVLTESLIEAMNNKTGIEFFTTLRRMVAKLQDGHGYVSNAMYKQYFLPVRVDLIENKIIVTSSLDSKIKVGTEILSIDEKPVEQELQEREILVSGSPYYRKAAALLEMGSSFSKTDASLIVIEDNTKKRITVKRTSPGWILEFNHDPIKKIEDGIYYISVNYADKEQFSEFLPELKKARGVIFDLRFTAKPRNGKGRIDMWNDILFRMTNFDMQSAKWCYPEIIYPSRKGITFNEKSWTAQPYPRYFNSMNVFITDGHDISHFETFMGIVENYKLGEIVGAPTAGANGNSNYFPLPGGFQTGFTGMRVLKHDGSQHHLIGIKPTYPVARTIKAVQEGRDEYLEKAIEVLKSKIK